MPANRRIFLQKTGLLTATAVFGSSMPSWARNLKSAIRDAEGIDAHDLAGKHDFWQTIKTSFTSAPGMINLNCAGVSPAPRVVADAVKKNYDFCNQAPSYTMWRVLDKNGHEPLRKKLAA